MKSFRMSKPAKVTVSVLLILAIVFCVFGGGLLTFLAFALGGAKGGVYMFCVTFAAIILFTFLDFQLWGKMKSKARYITFGALMAVPIVTFFSTLLYTTYHEKMDTVEQRLNLFDYAPFVQNTKTVSLDEPSKLALTEDLPRLDGATALYPVYAAFVQAVYPQGGYYGGELVRCTTTAKAYENLIKRETDIIFTAGISEEHRVLAQQNGAELVFTPIGREAFVFFVNSKNPVSNLTSAQIRGIYSGKITNWQEIGGKNNKITAYQREANSGSQTAFVGFMEGENIMRPPIKEIAGAMEPMIEVVAYKNYNNAIGYSFLFYATEMVQNERIKLLELDGIAPTRENVTNGKYPLSDYFYAVTVSENSNPNIPQFIDWILSEQGQYLIEKTGYTPLK